MRRVATTDDGSCKVRRWLEVRATVLVLGVITQLASCLATDPFPVSQPEEIWIKRGCDEIRSPHHNLDDLRDAPGGHSITDWRLQACVSFPPDHVPSGFVARHVACPGVLELHYSATGAREKHGQIVWFQYHPR